MKELKETEQNMTINPQLKAKYFAMYLGQDLYGHGNNPYKKLFGVTGTKIWIDKYLKDDLHASWRWIDKECLLLSSIEKLSVDEKLELLQVERLNYKFIQVNKCNIADLKIWIDDNIALIQSEVISNAGIDYLRSIGIALPFLNPTTLTTIGVSELIEQGIIKLNK